MAYKNKIRQREKRIEWYFKNRERLIAKAKEYIKEKNYKNEKTPEQRLIRNIKRQTRYYFPLAGHNCEFCPSKAEEHHHNTEPIEFDKFNYTCKKCHKEIHALKQCKEVKE